MWREEERRGEERGEGRGEEKGESEILNILPRDAQI
jgi:hypothetical protein